MKLTTKNNKFLNLLAIPLALFLASCTNNLTSVDNPTRPTATASSKYNTNQETLKKIEAISIKGRIGVLNPKEQYSANFSYLSKFNKDYQLVLDIPYSAKQVKVFRLDNKYYLQQDGKLYTADTKEEFATKLFGFDIPLEKLTSLLVGVADIPYEVHGKQNILLLVENNLVKTQVLNNGITISYKDYKDVGSFPVQIPHYIYITQGDNKVKIKVNEPYTIYLKD